jgi:hypothetical protein
MNQLTAERIINSLESGIVPIEDVDFFNTGRGKECAYIEELLHSVEGGASDILFVHGDYGIGKTHLLGLTKVIALERKFIVSHVTLSSRECPLSKMTWVYGNILRNITYKDFNKPTSLISFLDLWLQLVNDKVLKFRKRPCKHSFTYETCGHGCIDDLYNKFIPALKKIPGDLKNAIKLYQHAVDRNNEELKILIIRWMIGDKLTRSEYKRINGHLSKIKISNNIDEKSTFEMFKNIADLSKLLGFNGFVILLDEAERIPSIHNMMDGYFNLMNLIIQSMKMNGVLVIYATTPQFYDDAKRNFKYFENEETKELLKGIYSRMEEKRINLTALDQNELVLLSLKILSIYLISKQIENIIDQQNVWSEIKSSITPLCQNAETMRGFISDVFPIIKQHVSNRLS